MTPEQRDYGFDWLRCTRCTVHAALGTREWSAEAKGWVCRDAARCARWLGELRASGLVAGVDAVDLDFATGPRVLKASE